MSNPTSCPHCGSMNLIETCEGVPPPHYAKLLCGACGKHLKWIGGPASGFRMPFGKYRGSTLAEIDKADRKYLQWVAGSSAFSNPKVQGRVREYLSLA